MIKNLNAIWASVCIIYIIPLILFGCTHTSPNQVVDNLDVADNEHNIIAGSIKEPIIEKSSNNDNATELKQVIAETNRLYYPYDLGNGLIMTALKDEGEYVTYYFLITDEVVRNVNDDELQQSKQDIKYILALQSRQDKGNKDILSLFHRNNKGIKYHYYSDLNNLTYDIIFPLSELAEILAQSELEEIIR